MNHDLQYSNDLWSNHLQIPKSVLVQMELELLVLMNWSLKVTISDINKYLGSLKEFAMSRINELSLTADLFAQAILLK